MENLTNEQLLNAQKILQAEKVKKRWVKHTQEQRNRIMEKVREGKKTKIVDK